jgi:hypothetical protein
MTEILLKVVLNTISQAKPNQPIFHHYFKYLPFLQWRPSLVKGNRINLYLTNISLILHFFTMAVTIAII